MSTNAKVIRDKSTRTRPDIRLITRLVPPGGNLVQGQSELTISPVLANAAGRVISASQNHYSPAEGVSELREAVAEKISLLNGIKIDPIATPPELLITPGATGGLVAVAHTYLQHASAIVFEPYYPYHRRIVEELGGQTEVVRLEGKDLVLNEDELRARCSERDPHRESVFGARKLRLKCIRRRKIGRRGVAGEIEIAGRADRNAHRRVVAGAAEVARVVERATTADYEKVLSDITACLRSAKKAA
jgi:hypothetical protein